MRGLLLGITGSLAWALRGAALPQDGKVSSGQVEIQQPNTERLNIVQTSERAVINWNSFNIGASEWVNFQQPSATSATLNRVTGGFTSEIAGRLTANGQLYLVNPNGILFTPTAQINVGSFLATTLDIQNTDFMQGQLRFRQTPGMSLSTVENEGNITVAEGGFAALVAPGVANRGVINAYLGSVVLGSGTEATLDFYGDGLFSFAVDPTLTGQIFGSKGQPLNALVSNSGSIAADGGVVRLSAQAGASVVNNVINMDGVILARTAENRLGTVVLSGGNTGTVAVSGTLDVSGQAAGQMGGTINVLGNQVNLIGPAQLLASGDSGGGTVLVGGDYQGKGNIPTAFNTTVGEGVQIRSDALTHGNGGKVIVWANGLTSMNGLISAQGGATAGNGGFVETSGQSGLSIAGTASVNVGATHGAAGTWLLDPDRLFIDSGSSANLLPGPLTGDYFVAASVVQNALSTGNVTLAANDLIQVDTSIDSSTQLNSNTLTFADQNQNGSLTVNLNAPILLASTQTLNGEATVVNINQAFQNIVQNGVDLAASGATLNVANGSFTGTGSAVVNINKNLSILGQGTGNTIFDGENARRVFNITTGTVTLDGLTITKGNVVGTGAGILVGDTSNLTVRDSTISENRAVGDATAPPNTTGFGGGIFNTGTVTFINDDISGNIADFGGGGFVNYLGTAALLNSTVTGNSVTFDLGAGGIGNVLGNLTISNSTISNNTANGEYAGGLANGGGTVTITNSTFSGNTGTNFGGISNTNLSLLGLNGKGQVSISNSTISGNTATAFGGGIANVGGLVTLNNSTITNNTAEGGGGIFNSDYFSDGEQLITGQVTISNSIVAGNFAASGAEVLNGGTFTSLGFNLVGQNGNAGGFSTIATDIILSGSINTVLSPLANNGGLTQTHALVAGSPAIDAGNDALAIDPITGQPLKIDQRGGERAPTGLNAGSNVDIGAYEATSSTVVTNTGDDNSFGNLRSAVSFANGNLNNNPLNISAPAPNTIKFDTIGVFSTPRTIGLNLGELTFDNPTTAISLQGTGANNLTVSGKNASRVFNIEAGTVSLDGLTLTKGNVIGNGAGIIVNSGSNLTVRNSTLTGNTVIEDPSLYGENEAGSGGGIAAEDATVNIVNSTITDNTAETGGGGIFQLNGTFVIENSTVSNNTSEVGGGGIANGFGTLTITKSTISKNIANDDFAGGLANVGGTVTIASSTFSANTGDNGGAISNQDLNSNGINRDGKITIFDSKISNNIARINGGGIFNEQGSEVTILNSTLLENISNVSGGGVFNGDGIVTIVNSHVSKNTAQNEAGGILNRSGLLIIKDSSSVSNNSAATGGGIFNDGNTNIIDSIISGNTSSVFSGGIYNRNTLTVENSEISNNSGGSFGGGIDNFNSQGTASVTVTNSTISGNAATNGGGIYSNGTLLATNNTITNNAGQRGGGIHNEGGAVKVSNSIIAGNIAPTDAEVFNTGTFNSLGFNLVGQNGNAGGFIIGTNDIVLAGAIETAIAPLADNGGPTQTHALIANSPAIDAGGAIPGIATDQRGVIRPQGNAPDIGAFESSFTRVPEKVIVDPTINVVNQIEPPIEVKTTSTSPVSPIIPQPSEPLLASAPVQELDRYFSSLITGYLGLNNVPADTIDQAKTTLGRISTQVAGVTPSLIYTYFAPAPKAQTAGKLPLTLIASAQPLSGLLVQATEPKSDKCLSEKPARPTDPIWQFDSCGWDRIFPKGAAGNENDQLVLVLVTSDGKVIRKQIADATRGKMVKAVRRFQGSLQGLRDVNTYLPQAQQLYSWLVAPLEESLKTAKVNNLVFIMDKGLRALPLAALHDGTGFIVERYSVGVMPSLTLTDTRYVNLQQTQVLAMGASEFKDLAALPAVPLELSTISKLWSGESLLNETFTPQQLKQLRSSKPYGIVHLATHGEFQAGSPEQSYIQFWDTKVNLKQMQSLNLTQPSPVSLLVLSACRTALGDQDAELGFTGLAVSAGVQTALGGLWNISDLGTLALMSSFYSNLKTAPIKAEALRQAQIAMLKGQVRVENNELVTAGINIPLSSKLKEQGDANLAHPYYWSGITMVGNPW
jgi:filamentous hemagglutinin family protein